MIATLFTLALAGCVSASPIIARDVVPNYPPKELSKGFNLIVNVTDPSRDLSPSIQNTYVVSIHAGAGQAFVGQSESNQYARLFYVNGTAEEVRYGRSTVISDAGSIRQGLGLSQVPNDELISYVTLNGGPGQNNIGLTRFPDPYVTLYSNTYFACTEPLPYYGGKEFVVIKHAKLTVGEDGSINYNVPEGCAPVNLIPQCAKLNDLPAGAPINHDFAADSSCYPDVASLDWTQYGP